MGNAISTRSTHGAHTMTAQALTLVALILLPALAVAGPQVDVADDGTVVVQARSESSVEDARAVLEGEVAHGGLSPEVLSIETLAVAGRCKDLRFNVDAGPMTLSYTVRRCATRYGWTETLLQSDEMERFTSEWRVEPAGNGSLVTLRVNSRADLPVPQGLQQVFLRKSAKDTVSRLQDRLASR